MNHGITHGRTHGRTHGVTRASNVVTTNKSSYTTAETIQVSFVGSTTIRDWLNIVPVGSGPGVTGTWIYCGTGNQSASALLAAGTWPMGPIAAGTYEVRFLFDNGYTVIGTSTPFTVT